MATKAAAKFKADDVVVAMEAHCNPAVEGLGIVAYESEWRGDDPAVAAAPHLFTLKSTPRNQWKSPFDTAVERNDESARQLEEKRKAAWDRAAASNAVKIEPAKLVRAKRDVVGELDGAPATVRKGSQLPADHPFVREHEDAFA